MGIFSNFFKKEDTSLKDRLRNRQFDEIDEHVSMKSDFMFLIESIKKTENSCLVGGKIESGSVKIDDILTYNGFKTFDVDNIFIDEKKIDKATKGDKIFIEIYCNENDLEIGGVLKK